MKKASKIYLRIRNKLKLTRPVTEEVITRRILSLPSPRSPRFRAGCPLLWTWTFFIPSFALNLGHILIPETCLIPAFPLRRFWNNGYWIKCSHEIRHLCRAMISKTSSQIWSICIIRLRPAPLGRANNCSACIRTQFTRLAQSSVGCLQMGQSVSIFERKMLTEIQKATDQQKPAVF